MGAEENAETPTGPAQSRQAPPEFLVVGEVTSAQGIEGALRVRALSDFAGRFAPGSRLLLEGEVREVEWSRPWKGEYLVVKFHGITNRSEAERYRGKLIEIPGREARPLPPGQYYYFQLLGLNVYTTTGEYVGRIVDILSTGANDVYVVRRDERETLVPAIAEVVRSVDLAAETVTIEPLRYLGE